MNLVKIIIIYEAEEFLMDEIEERKPQQPQHTPEHHHKHTVKSFLGAQVKRTEFWQILTATFAVLFIATLFTAAFANSTTSKNYPSQDEVRQGTIDFLKIAALPDGYDVKITEMKDAETYDVKLVLSYAGEESEITALLTKDGKWFYPQERGIEITEVDETQLQDNTQTTTTVPKTDKPVVEVFVMSHCPYGTQIEKGALPVANLLGDKIDFKIKFVDYAMHGQKELNEQLLQYCMQKDDEAKYKNYLTCFLGSGDSTACLASTGLSLGKYQTCITQTDNKYNVTGMFNDKTTWLSGSFPQFNVYKAENDKYGVQGSPTLVINGVQSSSGRDSQSLLTAICSAFNNAPAECSQTLSSASPSAGFGYTEGTAGTDATCG